MFQEVYLKIAACLQLSGTQVVSCSTKQECLAALTGVAAAVFLVIVLTGGGTKYECRAVLTGGGTKYEWLAVLTGGGTKYEWLAVLTGGGAKYECRAVLTGGGTKYEWLAVLTGGGTKYEWLWFFAFTLPLDLCDFQLPSPVIEMLSANHVCLFQG